MSTPVNRNLTWQDGLVTRSDREAVLSQRGCVVWLTGLSGSGKSTIARSLEQTLVGRGKAAYVLDGDNVRQGLNKDLGFSPTERAQNIRRIGEVAALFADAGLITVTAFISPYRAGRDAARALVDADRFIEVHVHASLEACELRDPKGLYGRARAGEIDDFTGIDAPYEAPLSAEITLETEEVSVAEASDQILALLEDRGLLR